jgi:hypothetical protein
VGGRDGDSFLSPELQRQSIERVCQREGLELVDVVEELDCFSRSLPDALAAVQRIEGTGGRLYSEEGASQIGVK